MAEYLASENDRRVAAQIERGRRLLSGGHCSLEDQEAWKGYLAGFERSGEGFNGEYVGRRFRDDGALEAYLRVEFEKWQGEPQAATHEAENS